MSIMHSWCGMVKRDAAGLLDAMDVVWVLCAISAIIEAAMKVSELGEFGLIEVLRGIIPQQGVAHPLLVGLGDDAAAWQGDGSVVLATTDTLVQGVHFSLAPVQATWREVGGKSLAVNLSDIAAMGGTPQYALVALALPGDTEVEEVVQLYRGMVEAAGRFEVTIAGGNISRAPVVMITLTVIGQAQGGSLLTRSGARAGDVIAVTGYLGSSAAGHRMLSQGLRFDSETAAFLRRAHLQPWPRIDEGKLLVACGVRAAIDISDGLVSDLIHVCRASGVEARVNVEQVPLHPLVRAAFKEGALGLALAGGEDYELLFTADPEIIKGIKQKTSCPVTAIGQVVQGEAGRVTLVDKEGKPFPWEQRGWEHFSGR